MNYFLGCHGPFHDSKNESKIETNIKHIPGEVLQYTPKKSKDYLLIAEIQFYLSYIKYIPIAPSIPEWS